MSLPHFHAVGTPNFKDGYPCHCTDGTGFETGMGRRMTRLDEIRKRFDTARYSHHEDAVIDIEYLLSLISKQREALEIGKFLHMQPYPMLPEDLHWVWHEAQEKFRKELERRTTEALVEGSPRGSEIDVRA